MANIYLQNTVFCVAGFLLGISISATFARGDAAPDKVAVSQDILAQSGRVRLRVQPSAAERLKLKEQTASVFKDAFAVSEEQVEPNRQIEALVEPQSRRPDESPSSEETAALTPGRVDEPEILEPADVEPSKDPREVETQPAGSETVTNSRPNPSPEPMAEPELVIEYGLHLASLSRPENVAEMIENLEDAFTDELSDRSFYEMKGENTITGRKFIRLVSAGYENRDAALSQCDRLKAQGQYCAVVQIQR
ncbi:MAG: SPOR domain-containing protein [Pseudomonadota bacterium]